MGQSTVGIQLRRWSIPPAWQSLRSHRGHAHGPLSVSVVAPNAGGSGPTNPLAASDPVTISEDDGQAVFNVTLNQPSDEVVTVHYTTVSGTATSDENFLATSGTLTFAPGETSQIVTVAIFYDRISETSELFSLEISNANVADNGSHLSDLDSLIRVFDSLGRDVTSSAGVVRSGDAAPGDFFDPDNPAEYLDDYLSWTAAEAGVYFIGISSYLNGQYSPLSDPNAGGSEPVSQPRAGEVGEYEVEFILGEPAPPVISIGDVNIARNQTRADFELALSYPATDPVTVNYTFASDTATGHIIGNNDHSLDAPAINFNALGVPSVTLAGGYHVDSNTPLTDDWIDALLVSGNSNTGTFTGDHDGDWSYVIHPPIHLPLVIRPVMILTHLRKQP